MTVLIWPRRRRRVALESTIFRIITPAWMSSLMSEISPPCLGDSCFTRILVADLPLTDGHLLSQGDWPYAHQNFEARIRLISRNMHFWPFLFRKSRMRYGNLAKNWPLLKLRGYINDLTLNFDMKIRLLTASTAFRVKMPQNLFKILKPNFPLSKLGQICIFSRECKPV